ncbi:MAG: SpoIIE family protein phosphatase [Spirochaetes bacterium]|nr:SpoIIE family protein phosphatase [Spirochaetota bacterium]
MEGILDASRFSGIANYNANGEMVLCNPTFLDLFGDDIRKRPLCELFLNREHWQDFLAKLDSDGGIFGSMDLLRSDGSHLQAQTACTLRKGTAGENIGYLLIVRDESEERSLRHDLERSYRELEEKVVQRTSELRKTLDEVQRLKQMQDGDYFLTTLLLEPLSLNSVDSQNFSIETFTRQKKTFAFKAREYEIGGDLNIACTLQLRQKKYTLVLNGDAMGKSIQGAGGILVLGSLMRAIIERSRLSPIEREYYPERWLKNAINEIQLVFESFNGSMMVSAIIGLLDDETGCLYYVNAEHPAPVVFRDNCAAFIDQGTPVRKIGIPGVYAQTRVRIFRLLPNDVLFFGSDGKDDLLLESIDAIRKVNEDENLFVRAVEKSQGSLQKIIAQIERSGEIMDDLSLLRIAYHPQQIKAPANLSVARGKLLQALAESKNANDVERCRALCESHINAYPDDADAIARMGRFYKNGRNYAAAIDCFERLRLRGKASLKVLQLLVDLHAYSGNLARAAQILEECLEMDTQNTKTLQLERSLKRKQAAENNQTTAA